MESLSKHLAQVAAKLVTQVAAKPVARLAGAMLLSGAAAHSQAIPAATRPGDLQIGGTAVVATSQYLPYDTDGNPAPLSDLQRNLRLIGGGAYASFEFREHYGVALDFHHLNARNDTSSQTTYELGGRYIVTHRLGFAPYGRVSFGRGVYDYSNNAASLGFNLYGLAAGTDYHLSHSFNLRAEYEYQSWLGVPLRNPQPQSVSVGIAYHFHDDIVGRSRFHR